MFIEGLNGEYTKPEEEPAPDIFDGPDGLGFTVQRGQGVVLPDEEGA